MSEKLKTDQIKVNGGTQVRAGLSSNTLAEYVLLIQQAQEDGQDTGETIWPFRDPIDVYYDGDSYWLADGFHRVAASNQAGRYVVEANVHQGTQRDAILHAAGANAEHGLPRSHDDKRRAVKRLLEDDEWGKWSDREIARRCKVSHPFVAGIRREFTGNITSEPPTERVYVTRHGTEAVMNTEKIGRLASDYADPDSWGQKTRLSKIKIIIEKTIRGKYDEWYRNGIYTDLAEQGPDHPDYDSIPIPEWAHPQEIQSVLQQLSNEWPEKIRATESENRLRYGRQATVKADDISQSPYYVGPNAQGPQVREALEQYARNNPSSYESIIRVLADKEASGHDYKMNLAMEALGTNDMFIWHQAMVLKNGLVPNEEQTAVSAKQMREEGIPFENESGYTVVLNPSAFAAARILRDGGHTVEHTNPTNPGAPHDELRVWKVDGREPINKTELWALADNEIDAIHEADMSGPVETAVSWLRAYVDPVHHRHWIDLSDNQVHHANSPCFQAFKKQHPDIGDHKTLLKQALVVLKQERAEQFAGEIKAALDVCYQLVARASTPALIDQLNQAARNLDAAWQAATAVAEEA